METRGELALGNSTTSTPLAELGATGFCAFCASAVSFPARRTRSSRPAARRVESLMVGSSLGRLRRLAGRVGEGHFGLVLGLKGGAGEPLDVSRRHLFELREAPVDVLNVAGLADRFSHLAGHLARSVQPEGEGVALVRLG